MESVVKLVKGTEKFWSEEGAEALSQLRADQLSDDQPLEAFWQRRQDAATGQRRYRPRRVITIRGVRPLTLPVQTTGRPVTVLF
jgi:hypothetical protein